MLREQLFDLAMKTIAQAYETKERIKNNLKSEAVQNYMRSVKDTALLVLEHQWQKLIHSSEKYANGTSKSKSGPRSYGGLRKSIVKKERKSSIKPAKEIDSQKADVILKILQENNFRIVKKNDSLDGKKSLAYLVWALGHAERANISEGISVHDVSALLYRASKIELYPINISRVVFSNTALVKQVGQHKRTKTYLLTTEGNVMFREKFLV